MNVDKARATDELLPCPFCGGKAVDRREIDGLPMIYCNSDECFGPQTTARSFEDALVQWNARSPSPPPASFRRIYDKMQRGKVPADDRAKS